MISKAVIDYTAFFSNDRSTVIIKEMSVMDVETMSVQHWVFKHPKESGNIVMSSTNRWFTNYFHGLDIFTGSSEYSSLTSALDFINDEIKLLYAPSAEKAKYLEKLFKNRRVVFDLEALGCPRLDNEVLTTGVKERDQCLIHHVYASGFYCTQNSVRSLAKWCTDNSASIDMNNPDVRAKTFVNWKLTSPTVKELAEYGFVFCVDTDDTVKCVYCGLSLYDWKEGDDVQEDHDFNSPFCIYSRYKQQQRVKHDSASCRSTDIDDDYPRCCLRSLTITQDDVFKSCHA